MSERNMGREWREEERRGRRTKRGKRTEDGKRNRIED